MEPSNNSVIDELFLSVSRILGGIRVSPYNYRVRLKEIASARGITSKDKTDIMVEMFAALIALAQKIEK